MLQWGVNEQEVGSACSLVIMKLANNSLERTGDAAVKARDNPNTGCQMGA
jgi:hypothetical protein